MAPKFPEIDFTVYAVLSSDFYPVRISPRIPDGITQIGWHLTPNSVDADGNLVIESWGYGDSIDDYVCDEVPSPAYGPIHADDVNWNPVISPATERWFASL